MANGDEVARELPASPAPSPAYRWQVIILSHDRPLEVKADEMHVDERGALVFGMKGEHPFGTVKNELMIAAGAWVSVDALGPIEGDWRLQGSAGDGRRLPLARPARRLRGRRGPERRRGGHRQ